MLGGRSDPQRWIYNLHMSRGWMSSLNGLYPTFTLHEVLDLEELAKHLSLLRPQVFCMLSSYLKHLLPISDRIQEAGVELIVGVPRPAPVKSANIIRRSIEYPFGTNTPHAKSALSPLNAIMTDIMLIQTGFT